MKKKIIAFALALCLLCGAFAFADTYTEPTASAKTVVSCTVEGGYTVTIPASVTIDLETRKGSGEVTIAANPILPAGKSYVNVILKSFAYVNGAANYLRTADGSRQIYYIPKNGDTKIYAGNTILRSGAGAAEQKATLNFEIPASTAIEYAGTYRDTLTFSVELS